MNTYSENIDYRYRESEHPYYPQIDRQPRRAPVKGRPHSRALTTLTALEIIRKRYEAAKNDAIEKHAMHARNESGISQAA